MPGGSMSRKRTYEDADERALTTRSSKNRHGYDTRPHVNPKKFSPEEMSRLQEELRENKYKDRVCEYCTTSSREIRHHHFSTAKQREFTATWSKGDHMCPICNRLESPTPPGASSNRLILSDSTLYGVWSHPDITKNSEHFDIECIVGGRIRDLTRALKLNLLCNSYQLDIVVIAGINNVAEGQSSAAILEEFKDMKVAIQENNSKYRKRGDVLSKVSISTLCLPPKLCSFNIPDSPSLAEWKPGPGFINRYPVLKEVNEAIKRMNLEDNINYLNIHMQGIKILKSGPQHKYDTREGTKRIWREKAVFSKLHFTSENKQKLIRYIQNTFKSNAGK